MTGSFQTEQQAARVLCSLYGIDQDDADALLGDPTGAALLTLLANAAAKTAQETQDTFRARLCYEFKNILLRRAIRMARDWWAAPHHYGESGYADTVVYIETPFARFSYHCQRDSHAVADFLANAPTSERGWSGLRLQPYALPLVRGYLDGITTAAEVIEHTIQI